MALYRSAAVTRDLTSNEKQIQGFVEGPLTEELSKDNPLFTVLPHLGWVIGGGLLLWGLAANPKGIIRIVVGAGILAANVLRLQGKTWNLPAQYG